MPVKKTSEGLWKKDLVGKGDDCSTVGYGTDIDIDHLSENGKQSREREETEVNNLKEESLLKQSSAFKVSESTVRCGTNIAIFHFSENGKHMGEREKTELKKLNQESIAKESSSLPASERVIFATMDRVRLPNDVSFNLPPKFVREPFKKSKGRLKMKRTPGARSRYRTA